MSLRPALAVALATLLVPFAGSAEPASQPPVLAETRVRFAVGSAGLGPEGRASLDRVREALSDASELHVVIEGHADATGSAARNEELSRQRAESVAARLEAIGLRDARIEVRWYGSRRPSAQGDSAGAYAENRRVDVRARGVVRPVEDPVVVDVDGPEEASAEPTRDALAAADDERTADAEAAGPGDEPDAPAAAIEVPSVVGSGPAISPWWAVAPAVVGLLAAGGATGFFADYALNAGRLDQDRAELARNDLLPGTRSAVQDHAATLEGALLTDLVAGTILASTAAAALVTTGVLLLVAGGEE